MPPKRKSMNSPTQEVRNVKANTGKPRQSRTADDSTPMTGLRRSARTAAKQKAMSDGQDKTSGQGKRKSTDANADATASKTAKLSNNSKSAPKSSTGGKRTIGSKHDKADPPAKQGSNTRLPIEGSTAHWKAMPGWVSGQVLQILTRDKDVNGKNIKASKEEPRVVLKSDAKSGKICVHKPDNVYFDD